MSGNILSPVGEKGRRGDQQVLKVAVGTGSGVREAVTGGGGAQSWSCFIKCASAVAPELPAHGSCK